jgi:hypothetical protein
MFLVLLSLLADLTAAPPAASSMRARPSAGASSQEGIDAFIEKRKPSW